MTNYLRSFVLTLVCGLVVGVSVKAQQTIFSQNFQTVTTLTSGAANSAVSLVPNNTQFTSIFESAPPKVRIQLSRIGDNLYDPLNRQISLYRDADYVGPGPIALNRTADLNFSFGKFLIQFSIGVPVSRLQTVQTDSVALRFFLGTGFSDNASAPTANIYTRLSISVRPSSGANRARFRIDGDPQNRFFQPTYDTTTIFGGEPFPITNSPTTVPITIAVNNTAQPVDYVTPAGTQRRLAPDRMDVWVSRLEDRSKIPPTLVLDGVAVVNGAVNFTDFKFLFDPRGRTQLDIDNILIRTIENVLPVELAYFKATATARQQVALEWATASEQRSAYFLIQRSRDLQTFEDVAKVTAAGDSKAWRTYSSIDDAPLKGTSYYRLKQVDTDGTEHLYRPVPVTIEGGVAIDVFPNPAEGREFFVQVPQSEDLRVELFSVTGHKIPFAETWKNPNVLAISPTEPLTGGVYLVNVTTSEGVVQKKLFVR